MREAQGRWLGRGSRLASSCDDALSKFIYKTTRTTFWITSKATSIGKLDSLQSTSPPFAMFWESLHTFSSITRNVDECGVFTQQMLNSRRLSNFGSLWSERNGQTLFLWMY